MERTAGDGRSRRLLLALGGDCAFACLMALATGAPPAIEATIAFGLAVTLGLEVQARRAVAERRPA